jgi:hypothetical protein
MRGVAPPVEIITPRPEAIAAPPEVVAAPPEFEDTSLTGKLVVEQLVSVTNSRLSISDEVTAERSLESITVRNIKPAEISMPDILMDDDTVSNERPLTRAEMERITSIAVQFGGVLPPNVNQAREEKSTLALDIDFSDFDSL